MQLGAILLWSLLWHLNLPEEKNNILSDFAICVLWKFKWKKIKDFSTEIFTQIILRCDLYSTLYGNGKYFLLHLWLGICICLTFLLRKKSCINFNKYHSEYKIRRNLYIEWCRKDKQYCWKQINFKTKFCNKNVLKSVHNIHGWPNTIKCLIMGLNVNWRWAIISTKPQLLKENFSKCIFYCILQRSCFKWLLFFSVLML